MWNDVMVTAGSEAPAGRRSLLLSMTWTSAGRRRGSHLAISSAQTRRKLAGTTRRRGHWDCRGGGYRGGVKHTAVANIRIPAKIATQAAGGNNQVDGLTAWW